MFDRLKFLFNQISFINRVRDDFFDMILGHHKIIAWERGYPVYSLIIPGLLGREHRMTLINAYRGVMQNRTSPFLANIAVTDKCNCNCPSCYFKETRRKDGLLSGKEVIDAIFQMERIGTSTIQLVGGEPLLRKDLFDILTEYYNLRPSRSNIVLFTNGSLLAEKARDLKKTGLNRIYVSLDYPDAERQDGYAGMNGLFEKILSGLREAVRLKFITGISLVIHNDTTLDDLEKVLSICKQYRLNEFYLCKEIHMKTPIRKVCSDDGIKKFIDTANRDRNNPVGINYYPYLSSIDGIGGCSAGATRYYIDPYGNVTPCDVLHRSFGNIKEEPLYDIWYRLTNTEGYGKMFGDCRYLQDLQK